MEELGKIFNKFFSYEPLFFRIEYVKIRNEKYEKEDKNIYICWYHILFWFKWKKPMKEQRIYYSEREIKDSWEVPESQIEVAVNKMKRDEDDKLLH